MAQTQTINTPQDYVNYTFNIEARGVAEVSSELMGLSNTVGNILGQIAFKTSEFLSHTDMLAIGTGAAISAMFVSATQDAIHFQQQIANVQAIGGEAINAQDIGNAAMEFSNKFGMATSSMTEGLEALARAGITSTSVMKEVLAEGVKLSKLEGLDLEDSINDLISTTNLLSQEGVDMNDPNYGQMVQAMNQHIVSTSESAPINAQNIIQSLQHVGGYASASGMDQDDLFAVIAQLGSRGTKGEMAGTALRAFIAAGQKDTAQRALARIGLNVSDLWNNDGETMLSISEMKDVLDNALEARGYSKQEKLEFYSDFAGYKQANQIMKIDTSEVQQYKESIANAWDLGKKLDVILGTVRGNLDRIWQTTQNFMTKVGSNLLNVMSAILTPVRIFLDIITKIPFADKAVAAGMIFVAFRTGLMIFNKLVPAIAGFMSGISDASDETRGFRSEWTKTREEIEKAKDIIFLLKNKDQEGLAKKHYEEHGLSAKNKMFAEDVIAGQMYMGSNWYQEHGRIPWKDLDDPVKDMITERFKGTRAFKQNYNAYVDRTRKAVNEITSEPIIIEDFENEDTLEAINSYVQEIFQLLNSDRTRGQTDNTADNDDNGSQDNRRRNAQARTLSNIFNNRVQDSTYGNVNFKYARTEEGYADAKAGLKAAYDDLRKYTRALSNTDSDNINSIQRNAYKKLFTKTVSERGQEATKTANESEIRLIFEEGQLESHEHDYEGIKDSQVQYIAKKLNLDDFKFHDYKNNDRRAEFAQAAHEAIQNISEDRRQAVIDEIINGIGDDVETKGTNKLWEESLDKIAIGRKNFLLSKPEIANSIVSQISNINTTGYSNNTEAVLDYFNGLDDSHEDWNIAIKTAMDVLKGDSQYSKIEENTIKYIADNIQRHKETILSYQADAEALGFSEGVRNEIEDVLNDMRNDEALLRQGGSLLGEAIVSGFIGDGLGRHSPGYMFWALVDEQTDINKAILQSRGLLNKNAGLLGLEMTETFNSNLGFDRVFDSGIEYLRRDSDVIKDIIDNFNRDEFRTDDEQDLEYDLLPMQIDAQDGMYAIPKVMQDFVQPYGFDVSNFQRFGTNFGTSIDSITQFESILWFTQTHSEFDLDKMFDSGLFDEDDIYDYLDLLTEAFHEEKTWSYFKLKKDHDIDPSTFDSMNKFIEDYYFSFLATMAQEMNKTIINAPGLYDNVRLYRGGRLPVGSDGLGEYLGTTSTSYAKRVADWYTRTNGAVNHTANVYAPEGTLGVYLNRQQFGDRRTIAGTSIGRVFDNQIEYALGSGQPFIELPNEATGQLSGNLLRSEGDVLLLDPSQITDVQQVIVDEISDMLNSGRTDSHILNLSGKQQVNLLQEIKKAQPMYETSIDDTVNNNKNFATSDSIWGHGFHDSMTGMLFDAAYYIKKTQNKNVAKPKDFFKLIESVNGKQAAKDAENFLNMHYSDALREDSGNIKLAGLMNLISKRSEPFKDASKDLKNFGLSGDISVQDAFDLMKQYPELEDKIKDILMDFIPSRRGEKYSYDFFKNNDLMNKKVTIPYEYLWLLGAKKADAISSHITQPNNNFIYNNDDNGKPKTSLNEAIELWDKLGPEAILNSDFRYHYDDTLKPTVENSFERMMTGLVFGTLGDESAPYGKRYRYGGMHLYGDNTKDYGATQTLNTLIHEFTHMAMQQDYRSALDENDNLYLPEITTSKYISGYNRDFFEEFESNFVANEVFGKLGLEQLETPQERVTKFYDVVEQAGYKNNLQWELYDEWIKNISENIDKFIDIGEAFDKKYSDLSPAEISQKWDEVRALVNLSNNAQELAMPGSHISGYSDYINEQRKAQEELEAQRRAAWTPGSGTAGYSDYINQQRKEQEEKLEAQRRAAWTPGSGVTGYSNYINRQRKEQEESINRQNQYKKDLEKRQQILKEREEKEALYRKHGFDSQGNALHGAADKEKLKEMAANLLRANKPIPEEILDIIGWQSEQGKEAERKRKKEQKMNKLSPSELEKIHMENDKRNQEDFLGLANVAQINRQNEIDKKNQQREEAFRKKEKQKEDARNQQRADEEYMKWYKEEKKRKEKLINDSTEAYTKQQDDIKRQKEIANLRKQIAEDEKRWGKEGVEYAAQKRKQLKELREKQKLTLQIQKEMIDGTLEHLQNLQGRGGVEDAPEEVVQEQKEKEKKKAKDTDYDDDYIERILGTIRSKYGDFAPDMDNKFNMARILVGFTGDHRNIVSGIDFAEKIHNKVKNTQNDFITSAAERVTKNQDTEKTQLYADAVGAMKTKLESATTMMYGFRDGLDKVAEVFPPLTTAVWAVDAAIQAAEAATWLLSIAHDILTGSEMFDQLATWGLVTSKQAEALSEMAAAGATWVLNGALVILDALMGPLGVVLLGIIAAIAAIKFWEGEHAKALEASRKELEENTARNNIALSQYKDLKKARENETDAMKKQQAARKEAIALYELEASRVKKMKSVNEESKLRNDAIWGEYGLRAAMQKQGLGFIAGGDFESQYQNYEGTTANIREIKENTLDGSMTGEQAYVASVYDKNSMFFSQVEVYKEPLQALYDKESNLIEKYGSIDAARGTKEFYDAVKEFSDATGINGKTAGMMLDWLETENRVNQATKIGQAEIGMIQARTQAKVMAIDAEGTYGLGDMNNLGDAMIVAQFQEMMNTAKTEMWWDLLFAYMNLILSALSPWDWFTGETAKNQKKVQAYQEGLNELDAQGNQILQDMLDNQAEREDYGNEGASLYDDTPFGAALQNAGMVPQQQNLNTPNLSIDASTTSPEVYDNFQQSVNEPAKVNTPNMNKPVNTNNQNITPDKVSQTVVHIHNININTEDDPEKIKSALMNLIIEMQEQVVPRTVSRTIGQAPNQTSQTTDITQNPNDSPQAEGTDQQNGANNNQNPTI